MEIRTSGEYLYVIEDRQLGGFITWMEKGISGVFMFTSGEKAEEYIYELATPDRLPHLGVCRVSKRRRRDFVNQMLEAGIEYAVIDVPKHHGDEFCATEEMRNYGIVDLKTAYGALPL